MITLAGCDQDPQEIIDDIDDKITNPIIDPNDDDNGDNDDEINIDLTPNDYEDLSDEAALAQYFADYNKEYDRLGSMSVDTTYTANIYNASDQLVTTQESEFAVYIDTVEQYCDISVVLPFQIYNFLKTDLHDIVDGR